MDRDAQLLKNRIALLQAEERQANKKINETKKRTKEVMQIKENKEGFLVSKMTRNQVEQMEINWQRKKNLAEK